MGVIYTASEGSSALRQGEVISGLVMARRRLDTIGGDQAPVVQEVVHPWAIVMSQDCDLDWDYRERQEREGSHRPGPIAPAKDVPNILFCEALLAQNIRDRQDVNNRAWNIIETNRDERHHFLQKVAPIEDALGQGIPELCTDFKRYFTIPTEEVYRQLELTARRRCRLNTPYLQHLCTRFCYFQFRVALPEPYESEPVGTIGS